MDKKIEFQKFKANLYNHDKIDIEKIREKYDDLKPKFKEFGKKIKEILEHELEREKFKIEHLPVQYRIKNFDSLIKKINYKHYFNDPLNETKDILGGRVITYYKSDLERVKQIIENQFEIIEGAEDMLDRLKIREFGYRSIHYIVRLNDDRKKLPECRKYKNLCAEIQLCTITEHIWAEIEHHLNYKTLNPENKLDINLERKLYALMALFEITNQVFDSIREEQEKSLKKIKINKNLKKFYEELRGDQIFNKKLFLKAIKLAENGAYDESLNFCNQLIERDITFLPAWKLKSILETFNFKSS